MRGTPDQATAMMKPYAGDIEAWEVGSEISNIRNSMGDSPLSPGSVHFVPLRPFPRTESRSGASFNIWETLRRAEEVVGDRRKALASMLELRRLGNEYRRKKKPGLGAGLPSCRLPPFAIRAGKHGAFASGEQ